MFNKAHPAINLSAHRPRAACCPPAASQIVTGIGINSAIGVLCYIGFVLWRTQ
jgi:hypothetical protein